MLSTAYYIKARLERKFTNVKFSVWSNVRYNGSTYIKIEWEYYEKDTLKITPSILQVSLALRDFDTPKLYLRGSVVETEVRQTPAQLRKSK